MHRRTFLEGTLACAGGALFTSPHRAFAVNAASPKIKIGQIGTGHSHAAGKMDAIRSLGDTYEVVGVVESDSALRAKAEKSSAYAGLTWLDESSLLAMADVPVVAVETRMQDAAATAARAIAAGKHIHLDKPGGFEHDEYKRMRLEAERRGLTVQMGFMLRYNPAFELLVRAVREGWLGEILEVDCMMGKQASAAMREDMKGYPGGGMWELACHVIDAVVTVLGKPTEVHAFSTPSRGDAVKDNQLAVLVYPKATATIRCDHADPNGGPRRQFNVTGTKGAMEIRPLESGKCRLMLSEPHEAYRKGDQAFALDVPANRYAGEFADLAKVVRGEKQLAWNAAHDVAVHETVLRASGAWH
jgi:predicted dehydrogenase